MEYTKPEKQTSLVKTYMASKFRPSKGKTKRAKKVGLPGGTPPPSRGKKLF